MMLRLMNCSRSQLKTRDPSLSKRALHKKQKTKVPLQSGPRDLSPRSLDRAPAWKGQPFPRATRRKCRHAVT